MPGSSMLANTACAGFMPSAWFTSSTPSRTKTAPPRPPCARRSGSSTAISRPIVARPPRSARPPLWQSSIASSPAKPASSPDRLLARLHANKAELLKVLDRPEIPLHTNGSENDIRCHVTRRKVSGGTRSDLGRDCRDAFLALAKTCAKLGITFWDYLGARLTTPGAAIISPLPQLVLARAKPP